MSADGGVPSRTEQSVMGIVNKERCEDGYVMKVLERLRGIGESPTEQYQCAHCELTYETSYLVCPSCGGDRLEQVR
jgi:DNA-directed RNA polymerase subunit RPC12/RpoP